MPATTAPVPVTANTPLTSPENRVRYPALDGIRAVALAMVFGQHYAGLPWGYTGVDLFFVLSGFLITGILYDTVDRPDRVRIFYIRRSLRIFPLYYGLLALLVLLTPLLDVHWSWAWLVWPAYLGNIIRFVRPYSQNPVFLAAANGWLTFGRHGRVLYLGHFWSLCLEEQFYLLWPWVVFWVRERRRLVWICSVVVLTWPVLRVVTMALLPFRYTEMELTYSFTPLRLDALLLGGLLALLIRGQHRQAVLNGCTWLCRVFLVFGAFYAAHSLIRAQSFAYPSGRLTWIQSVVDLLYAAMIATALVPGTVIYRICSNIYLRRIGQVSYGAYVFHDIPHTLYAGLIHRCSARLPIVAHHFRPALMLLAGAATLILAELSFRFFESPILDLKERWAPSLRASL